MSTNHSPEFDNHGPESVEEQLSGMEEDYLNDPQLQERLFEIGREGVETKGRGVVVVDLRRFTEQLVRIYYLSAGHTPWDDGEMEQIVRSYDTEREIIVFLFFDEFSPRNDCYKLRS